MKKTLLSLLILSISVGLFCVTNVNGVVNNGFRVLNETSDEVILEFNLPEYHIQTMGVNGEKYNLIKTDTEAYTTEVGFPMMPKFGTAVQVPYSGKVNVEVISSQFKDITCGEFYPAQEDGLDLSLSNLVDEDYSSYFPSNNVESASTFIVRDVRARAIAVNPFAYNKEEKKLRVYSSIKLKVTTDMGLLGDNEMDQPTSFSQAFVKLYESSIINFRLDSTARNSSLNSNVLFIHKASTDNVFNQKLGAYVKYKKQKGYNVRVADTSEIGGTSSSAIKTYIQNLYDGTEFRPDYVILLGDVSGIFGLPTHNASYANSAEGDYPYTHLAGSDYVGDIFIGRMSINSTTDMSRYYGKLRSFEMISTQDNDDYLDSMLLVGDTDPSGESTVNNCKFVKQTSTRVNPDYTYTELYSNNPSANEMNNAINAGVGMYVYRGYIGMSNWNPGSQTNVHKLTHAVINTCATGNFASTATTESFMNMGTEASPKGAVTAIGMATASTHTSFNNSLTGGIFHGMMNHNQRTMGEALLTGKLTTYIVYSESDMEDVKKFTHWCNLIGDPTLDIYIGEPTYLTATTSDIYSDSEELAILLTDVDGDIVTDANVSITGADGTIHNTLTNHNGVATFALDTVSDTYQLVANKTNYHPLRTNLDLASQIALKLSEVIIDDDSEGESNGNDNGLVDAGETIEINSIIENLTDLAINDIDLTISTMNPNVDIIRANTSISTIDANTAIGLDNNFVIAFGNNLIDGEEVIFAITCDYGADAIHLIKSIKVNSSNISLEDVGLVMTGNSFDEDESATITTTIKNISSMPLESATAVLFIDNGNIELDTESITLSTMQQDDQEVLNFSLTSEIDNIPGLTVDCALIIDNGVNFYTKLNFEVKFGSPNDSDPLGPDNYGYIIYDSNDTDYDLAPVYDWIEISPNLGGQGTQLDITDSNANGEGDGVGANSTDIVNLPFIFNYYGESYSQITVCSNGFISMGENSNGEFRNYRLPGALGPNGMIAAFWDDMHIGSNSGIYTYHNEDEGTFIIEWDRMVNGNDNHSDIETFQIILYDVSRYPTPLGQSPIKIQYKDFNDVDNGNPGSYTPWHGNYSTVGIESPDGCDGLEYVYNQNYPAGANTISDEFALYITTNEVELLSPVVQFNSVNVIDENGNNLIEAGEEVNISIGFLNSATNPLTDVSATLNCLNQYVTVLENATEYSDLTTDVTQYGHDYFKLQISEDTPAGSRINVAIALNGADNYRKNFTIPLNVEGSLVSFKQVVVNDFTEGGNNDCIIEAGEDIAVGVYFDNTMSVDGIINDISISSTSAFINFDNTDFSDVKIYGKKATQVVFDATISATATANAEIPVTVSGTHSNDQDFEVEYMICLNQSALAIDLDDSNVPLTLSGAWEIGVSNLYSSHTGSNVLATNLNSDYPGSMDCITWTDYFLVNSQTILTFWHQYQFEYNWDGGQVVAQLEGSNNTILLYPEGGYTGDNINSLNGAGYCGEQNSWTEATFDIGNGYSGNTLKIGFRAASDGYYNEDGWYIDDINISGLVSKTFVLHGSVELDGGTDEVENVTIEVADLNINPNEDGEFKILLPFGQYQVDHNLKGYSNLTMNLDQISNALVDYSETMFYLATPHDLTYDIDESNINLAWDYTDDANFTNTSFSVLRKFYTSQWQEIGQTTSTSYVDTISVNGDYSYKVIANYDEGISNESNTVEFIFVDGVDNEENVEPVMVNSLSRNYPNPFNPETSISFSLAKSTKATLKVYNVKGQLVKTLVNDHMSQGSHTITWHGKNDNNRSVSSGVYFFKLEADGFTQTNKAVLMK